MSDLTKKALGASLKKILLQKPLEKITITDLTNDCGVNRQTFYYHFHDIYDLIDWIYLAEGEEAIGTQRSYDSWQDGLLSAFKIIEKEKTLYLKYNSLSFTIPYHAYARRCGGVLTIKCNS